ncbi:PREDICTED: uncharacterized protein LOC102257677 [Myotis brandtii]|uniref:uncharacterized protein LOC102257677 n=1 Tax=Myotis brandtii TaxID=109478 RepID=UPI0007046CC1|nr:PREDICTED: uncharacterized protein LOC102257677 [Myotis brandtii]
MYSYIFRAARVNICRQRLLTPIPGRRGRRLALSVRRYCFSECLVVGNRGKAFRRPTGAVLCGSRAEAAGCRGPTKGRLSPGGRGARRGRLGRQPLRRPWAISKRRHLDSPNLWCGGSRCSPVLTSLFVPSVGQFPWRPGPGHNVLRQRTGSGEQLKPDSLQIVYMPAIFSSKPGGNHSTFRGGSNCKFASMLCGNSQNLEEQNVELHSACKASNFKEEKQNSIQNTFGGFSQSVWSPRTQPDNCGPGRVASPGIARPQPSKDSVRPRLRCGAAATARDC